MCRSEINLDELLKDGALLQTEAEYLHEQNLLKHQAYGHTLLDEILEFIQSHNPFHHFMEADP